MEERNLTCISCPMGCLSDGDAGWGKGRERQRQYL